MKVYWLISITLVLLAGNVSNQPPIPKGFQDSKGISDGHRLITRALWRIFDALMEQKKHDQLYGRVKVVEGALNNMMNMDTKIDSEYNGMKKSLDSFKDEIVVMKKELEKIKQMELKIKELEEYHPIASESQKDDGGASSIGDWAEAVYTSCPTPFEIVGRECIHVVMNNKRKWEDARIACAYIGGDLASPNDMDNFRKYLRNLPSDKKPTYAWIGGLRTEDDVWVWATGIKPGRPMDMSQAIWNVDLPNGIGDCVGLFELSGYRAYDYKCEEEDNFICQYFF